MKTKDKNIETIDKEEREKMDKLMKEISDEQMRLHPEIYDKEVVN